MWTDVQTSGGTRYTRQSEVATIRSSKLYTWCVLVCGPTEHIEHTRIRRIAHMLRLTRAHWIGRCLHCTLYSVCCVWQHVQRAPIQYVHKRDGWQNSLENHSTLWALKTRQLRVHVCVRVLSVYSRPNRQNSTCENQSKSTNKFARSSTINKSYVWTSHRINCPSASSLDFLVCIRVASVFLPSY